MKQSTLFDTLNLEGDSSIFLTNVSNQ